MNVILKPIITEKATNDSELRNRYTFLVKRNANKVEIKNAVQEMGNLVLKPDYWVGVESRGFIFASALAIEFGGGVVLCRKPGKLPGKIISKSYATEYSSDQLSLQIGTGSVVIVDDVLATGGTLATVDKLCFSAGYNVQNHLVLIDLKYVPRRKYHLETKIKTLIILVYV